MRLYVNSHLGVKLAPLTKKKLDVKGGQYSVHFQILTFVINCSVRLTEGAYLVIMKYVIWHWHNVLFVIKVAGS